MCLLTHIPAGEMPNESNLWWGSVENSDGHGFAIVIDNEITVVRGLNSDKIISAFIETRKAHPEGPAIFHSRIATHGQTDKSNCHPFFVGTDRRTVLGHNGIMPLSVQPSKKDHRSDTKIFAQDFLPTHPFGSIDSKRGFKRLKKWLGSYNKVVILTTNPMYRKNVYIVNEHEGLWDDGIWYSNNSYLPLEKRYPTTGDIVKSYGHYYSYDERTGTYSYNPIIGKEAYYPAVLPKKTEYPEYNTICRTCFAEGTIDPVLELCKWCHTCTECNTDIVDCKCPGINWDTPKRRRKSLQERHYPG